MALTRFFESDPDTGVVELSAVVDSGTGVSDHGGLTGLSDDDHLQYVHLAPTSSIRNIVAAGNAATTPLLIAGHTSSLVDLFAVYRGATKHSYVDQNGKFFSSGLDSRAQRITDVGTPVSGTDAANMAYVDGVGNTVIAYIDGLLDGDKGDITITSGVWTIDDDAVSYGKIQNVSATDKILGRSSSGAGIIEEIPCTAAGRALLDDADAAAQRTTLGAAPSDAEYICVSSSSGLSQERTLSIGSGLLGTDGGDNSSYTIASRYCETVLLTSGRQVFTNIAAGTTEYGANNPFRIKIDLSSANQIRLSCRVLVVGASGSATLFLQYSTDESSWSTLTSNTIALCTGSAGTRVTAYENVPAGAKSDVFIRWVTTGGDGIADPEIGNLYFQLI